MFWAEEHQWCSPPPHIVLGIRIGLQTPLPGWLLQPQHCAPCLGTFTPMNTCPCTAGWAASLRWSHSTLQPWVAGSLVFMLCQNWEKCDVISDTNFDNFSFFFFFSIFLQKHPFILMYEERTVEVASYVCKILDQMPATPSSPMYVD